MDTIYKKYEPVFGSWYIKEKIGQGSVGQVFLIEREDLDFTYRSALKAITVPPDENDVKSVMATGLTYVEATDYYRTFMDTLSNELKTMAKLKGQSNVVNYEDHQIIKHEGEIGWDILIRLELLTPLVDKASHEKLTEDDVLKLGIDICRALELCGKHGIIHRDIKPENIFISESGDFKLGDFGISRMIEETRVGLSRKGTFTYMAPEVFNGKGYDFTADIYSLGLVMYKFLNEGRDAFMPVAPAAIVYEDNDKAFFKRMSGEELPEPVYGSDELKRIVLKACSPDPADRYQDAGQMRAELEDLEYAIRRGGKASSEGTRAGSGTRGDKKSKRLLIAAAAVVVAVLMAFFLWPEDVEDIDGIGDSETILYGDRLSPEYTVRPESLNDEPMSFASGNEKVFTVDKDGTISAHGVGEGTLSITVKDYTKKVSITVAPKVRKITGVKKRIEIYEGDTYRLSPKLLPEKYGNLKVRYRSTDRKTATVSKNGRIRAKKTGTCRIRINAGGTVRTVKITVKKKPYVQNSGGQYTNTYNGRNDSQNSSESKKPDSGNSGGSPEKNTGGNSGSDSGGDSDGDSGEGYFDSGDDEYF